MTSIFRRYQAFFAIVIAAALIAISIHLLPGSTTAADALREKAFVTRIIDGDTLVAEGEHVRLLGIDADERGGKCYAAAKERLEELVLEKEVTLETGAENRDQYDRLLRYVFANGTNVNMLLVEEGLAIARFYGEDAYKSAIIEAERTAREQHIGCKWE